jgi:four helix bundle protein
MSRDLKERTKQFSLDIIELVEGFEYSVSKKVVTNQLVRSATSVGANYRAASRARSDKEFKSKINIVLEEADECCFWLEIIKDKNWQIVDNHLNEANELTAIFVSIIKKLNSKTKSTAKT